MRHGYLRLLEAFAQQGKPYSVYSPWYRNWSETVTDSLLDYVGDCGTVEANDKSARTHPVISKLLGHQIPAQVKGFELDDEDKKNMEKVFPVGDDIVDQVGMFVRLEQKGLL